MGRPASSETQVITFGPNEYDTIINLLNNFAIYNMEITAFTIKGEGPRSKITKGCKLCDRRNKSQLSTEEIVCYNTRCIPNNSVVRVQED